MTQDRHEPGDGPLRPGMRIHLEFITHEEAERMRAEANFEHIRTLIRAFLEMYPSAEFGPAHIVLSDYNMDNASIQWVNDHGFTDHDPDLDYDGDAQEIEATNALLRLLLTFPEQWREWPASEIAEIVDRMSGKGKRD